MHLAVGHRGVKTVGHITNTAITGPACPSVMRPCRTTASSCTRANVSDVLMKDEKTSERQWPAQPEWRAELGERSKVVCSTRQAADGEYCSLSDEETK